MKNTDTLVQMHHIHGNTKLIQIVNDELVSQSNGINTIRITQRMRLEQTQIGTLMHKMSHEDNYATLVCLPCGLNREDLILQTSKMVNSFIEYFGAKSAAGIINSGPSTPRPSCVVHVFPPGVFSTEHLTSYASDLLTTIEQHKSSYLFIVITYNNG